MRGALPWGSSWGGISHPPSFHLLNTLCVEKFTLTQQSQILPSTRNDRSSGGFQSISRRLRGSFPHNHVHTLLCLPCNQPTKPKENSAP